MTTRLRQAITLLGLTRDTALHNLFERPATRHSWVYRAAVWVVPAIVFLAARRVCRELTAWDRVQETLG